MAKRAGDGGVLIRPLAPSRAEDVKTITRGSWGAQCWDLHPRLTASEQRSLGIAGRTTTAVEAKRREIVAKLARRRSNAPMLVAYVDREPAGFVSLGPRSDFSRVANSKATPPVDDVAAWVIPCLTVRRGYRGRGVGVALLRAAVTYAGERGAPAIEGYPRAGGARVHDDFAYIGTEALFRKAGYRRVRGVMRDLPRGWTPRVTMRATCAPKKRTSSVSPKRSRGAS
jgi:GNAT superfamily N-acetyltransferase